MREMTYIHAECGAVLDECHPEWVREGCIVVESLDWLLDEAVSEGACLTAHRVRRCEPSDIDVSKYIESLWEDLREMIAEDEQLAHDGGTAELAAWEHVSQREQAALLHVLLRLTYNNVDTINAAWPRTGEVVTLHPDERVVLTREGEE